MKKLVCILLAALMCISAVAFTACTPVDNADDGKYVVGICQLVTHPALDQATQGFKDAVIAGLGEENVEFIEQNAGNDIPLCTPIANDFVSKNVDLIMANATPALTAAVNGTDTIPILGTSITEYGTALGIDNFDGLVGGNISGTSDLAPLDQQAQMILDLFPEAETVAMLYASGEANSKYQVKVVTEYLEANGITVIDKAFSDSNDVSTVAASAAAFGLHRLVRRPRKDHRGAFESRLGCGRCLAGRYHVPRPLPYPHESGTAPVKSPGGLPAAGAVCI